MSVFVSSLLLLVVLVCLLHKHRLCCAITKSNKCKTITERRQHDQELNRRIKTQTNTPNSSVSKSKTKNNNRQRVELNRIKVLAGTNECEQKHFSCINNSIVWVNFIWCVCVSACYACVMRNPCNIQPAHHYQHRHINSNLRNETSVWSAGSQLYIILWRVFEFCIVGVRWQRRSSIHKSQSTGAVASNARHTERNSCCAC